MNEIQRLKNLIVKIKNPYPPNDFIKSYQDFKQNGQALGGYQFNPKVLESLVELINDLWYSEKRWARGGLLEKIKRYSYVPHQRDEKITEHTKYLLFELFRKVFKGNYPDPNEKHLPLCNIVLKGLTLPQEAIHWLCDHIEESEMILNRVLRYPIKNRIISNWMMENYGNNVLRRRRAETIGLILNENPHFEVDEKTLIEDFEFLNQEDIKGMATTFENIINKYNHCREGFKGVLLEELKMKYSFGSGFEIPRRSYSFIIPSVYIKLCGEKIEVPYFSKAVENFHQNLPVHKKFTMIWAAHYSKLSNSDKFTIIQKYYCDDAYNSVLKIAEKEKNIPLLEWLMEHKKYEKRRVSTTDFMWHYDEILSEEEAFGTDIFIFKLFKEKFSENDCPF